MRQHMRCPCAQVWHLLSAQCDGSLCASLPSGNGRNARDSSIGFFLESEFWSQLIVSRSISYVFVEILFSVPIAFLLCCSASTFLGADVKGWPWALGQTPQVHVPVL